MYFGGFFFYIISSQDLLEAEYNRRKLVMCRDEASVGLLHKAVYYDFMDIADYLVKNYPQLVHMKDSVRLFRNRKIKY